MQLQFVIYHNYGNNSVYLVIIHSDLKQVYETHRDIYEGIKKPPPQCNLFQKAPPPNTTSVLSPLNNDKKLHKSLSLGAIIFSVVEQSSCSTKEDCVMIAPVTSQFQILHIESNTKHPSKINTSTKECRFFVLAEH